MTKKQLEKFIKDKWGHLSNEHGYHRSVYVKPLCIAVSEECGWSEYWREINTEKHLFMPHYFTHDYSVAEASLLRLLSLHLFIRHKFPTKKRKVKK